MFQLVIGMRKAWKGTWQTMEQLWFREAAARLGVGVFASGPLLEGTLLNDAALQVPPPSSLRMRTFASVMDQQGEAATLPCR